MTTVRKLADKTIEKRKKNQLILIIKLCLTNEQHFSFVKHPEMEIV